MALAWLSMDFVAEFWLFVEVSNEKNLVGWVMWGDDKLPNYVGIWFVTVRISINQPGINGKQVPVFFVAQVVPIR